MDEDGSRSGIVIYGDREFSKDILDGELVIHSNDAPFMAGNLLLDRSKGSNLHPNYQVLKLNYNFDDMRGPYKLVPQMSPEMENAPQKNGTQHFVDEALGNVVEIQPGENGRISLVGINDSNIRWASVSIPELSMLIMERNPLYDGVSYLFGVPVVFNAVVNAAKDAVKK